MKPTRPKTLFRENKTRAEQWATFTESELFQVALSVAQSDYFQRMQNPDAMAATNFYKMQGAREFAETLSTLGDEDKITAKSAPFQTLNNETAVERFSKNLENT